MTTNNLYKVTPSQAIPMIERVFIAGLVPYLHSSPGVGKSSLLKTIAANLGLYVIDIRLSQCDPADLNAA